MTFPVQLISGSGADELASDPEVVRVVDDALEARGFPRGAFGVRRFQVAHGLPQTGRYDPQTFDALGVELPPRG